jgi:hypothetical protein
LRLRDEYYVELITVKDKGGDPSAAQRRMELTRAEVLQKLATQVLEQPREIITRVKRSWENKAGY